MIASMTMRVYWVRCDSCQSIGQCEEAFLEQAIAWEWALDYGWTTDGSRHHCPECPPLFEVCS